MSDTWMRQYEDRTKAKSPDKGSRRAFVDLAVVRRFTLVYWNENNSKARIMCIQECPEWPNWRLSNAPETLQSLGTDITSIESYSETFNIWMQVSLDYTHVLTKDRVILLRRLGVTSVDEDEQIRRFLSPPTVQHLRYNLPAERAAVRDGYKKLKSSKVIVMDESDSEVEFVKTPAQAKKRRMKADPEQDHPTHRHCRQAHRLPSTPSRSTAPPINITSSPAILDLSSPSPTLSFSVTGSSPVQATRSLNHESSRSSPALSLSITGSSPTLPQASSRWPHGMFAVDIIDGFIKMDDPTFKTKFPDPSDRFENIFHCKFHPSTYFDQKKRWKYASGALRRKVEKAGRTPDGLWSVVVKAVPLRR
ncbi:hypothetical protein FPV67DRAFT_1664229 [Lyophyllum atratum]|nr:hypothetical protein FPV67DRAFT_1664229 [Lyophyllum atratum]